MGRCGIIVIEGNGPIEAALNQASELEKVKDMSAILLEAKFLSIKLVFQRLCNFQVEVLSTCNIVNT